MESTTPSAHFRKCFLDATRWMGGSVMESPGPGLGFFGSGRYAAEFTRLLKDLWRDHAGYKIIGEGDLVGSGRKRLTMSDILHSHPHLSVQGAAGDLLASIRISRVSAPAYVIQNDLRILCSPLCGPGHYLVFGGDRLSFDRFRSEAKRIEKTLPDEGISLEPIGLFWHRFHYGDTARSIGWDERLPIEG